MWSVLQGWFVDPRLDAGLSAVAVAIPIIVMATVTAVLNRFDVTPAGPWYPLVVGAVCGYLVYIAFNELRKARRFSTLPVSNPRAAYAEVCGLTEAAGDDPNVETALLVLDEARTGYNRAFSGSESMETKASALLSIVAGASSAIGIFGFGKDGRPITISHLIGAALVFVIVALGLLFYILRAKQLPQPSVKEYVVPAMTARDNRIGIALRLAVTYEDAGLRIAQATTREPGALLAAATLTAAAAVLILLNASFPCPVKPSGVLRGACAGTQGAAAARSSRANGQP